jgi:hypothetical protein
MFLKKITTQTTIFLLLIMLFLFHGCSRKESAGSYYESSPVSAAALEDQGLSEMLSFSSGVDTAQQISDKQTVQIESTAVPVERKLIKQADLRIEADPSFIDSEGKLSGINQKIDELMKRYGAYSESTRSDENNIHYTIRVPEVFYESLIAGTSILGKIRSRTESAEDVTIKYYDLEGRLNTKKALLSTFQGYLSRTVSIDDIMKVETRIAELQNEIDWLGNQLTRLGNLVDYATVELSIYTYYSTPSYTFGDRVKQLFGGFGNFASNAALVILGILVYAVPVIAICLIAFWVLFGRIGILKKAFRYIAYNGKTKKENNTTMEGEP